MKGKGCYRPVRCWKGRVLPPGVVPLCRQISRIVLVVIIFNIISYSFIKLLFYYLYVLCFHCTCILYSVPFKKSSYTCMLNLSV